MCQQDTNVIIMNKWQHWNKPERFLKEISVIVHETTMIPIYRLICRSSAASNKRTTNSSPRWDNIGDMINWKIPRLPHRSVVAQAHSPDSYV